MTAAEICRPKHPISETVIFSNTHTKKAYFVNKMSEDFKKKFVLFN
jgi:hypothetical protein